MEMPILQPFAIKTQKTNLFTKIWLLLFRKRQWQLTENWHYQLPDNRELVFPKGFIFDGSSYPAVVWLFFSPTGLLLIPVIIHDFCFQYNYLWAVKDNKVYKYKPNAGFFNWCKLIRKVGIERNELYVIDYFTWLLTIIFGWPKWIMLRRHLSKDLKPRLKS
ncbi:DUF1353 domain-containing protein [Thalassotalea piscium]|nr:DUF1353 domain-containing protein [Thalassotalea piscium]